MEQGLHGAGHLQEEASGWWEGSQGLLSAAHLAPLPSATARSLAAWLTAQPQPAAKLQSPVCGTMASCRGNDDFTAEPRSGMGQEVWGKHNKPSTPRLCY